MITRNDITVSSQSLPDLPGIQHADSPLTLRISVTDRCNFRCQYCMPSNGSIKFHKQLPLEKLAEITSWLVNNFPIKKVKLTGGEPLVRKGIAGFIAELNTFEKISEISLTTNGSLLADYASELKDAGLERVNVSLDTLDPEWFTKVTDGGHVERTIKGIDTAIKYDLTPLKLNSVLLKSRWRRDIPELLDFASERNLELRLIELMRTGTSESWVSEEFVDASDIRKWLENCTEVNSIINEPSAPVRLTRVTWHKKELKVGWITPLSNPFCSSCNRLRLDVRGNLHRCLVDMNEFSLAGILDGDSEDTLKDQVASYLDHKDIPQLIASKYPMSHVGG
ncbi:MAG: GTP 3',8-cyclase MoaA [Candidatus Electryonea clarkiae]|nr:GTP 3',8-cyclase MoaA [Candidatus Electryonea clarkiae]MDP8287786.1 GTP 3',8-cyclase MoaA [Candidatus Electryonea clarkiae]